MYQTLTLFYKNEKDNPCRISVNMNNVLYTTYTATGIIVTFINGIEKEFSNSEWDFKFTDNR